MVDRVVFAKALRDALAGLYDAVALQTSPLLEWFSLDAQPMQAPGRLRQLLRDAIDSLKPPSSVAFGEPEWLGYRLLWLKYVQRRPRYAICDQLGLSQRSYYRSHRQALEALTSLLWDILRRLPDSVDHPSFSSPMKSEGAMEEAMKLARHSVRQRIQVNTLLSSARPMMMALAERHHVDLQIEAPSSLMMVYADPAILRQVLLNVFAELIAAAPQRALKLKVREHMGEVVFSLGGPTAASMWGGGLDGHPGIEISRGVLEVYGGRLWLDIEEPCKPELCFSVPTVAAPVILVIDDDLDTAELYRRFLEPHGYALEIAQNAKEVRERLADHIPQLIILDVLMPREDGWDILLDLNSRPQTARVPVVICSVLSQPELALAMGAADVLNKPVEAEALLGVVKQILARQDTES